MDGGSVRTQQPSSTKNGLSVVLRRNLAMVTQQKAGTTIPTPAVTSSVQKEPSAPTTKNNVEQPPNDDSLLQITDSCWKRLRHLAQTRQDPALYLRVFVDAGGCSGFQYQFELESGHDDVSDDDVVFQKDHAPRVVVDAQSLNYMRGATIDYTQEMIKSSFEVRNNPQSESACGCGSSFAVKNFSSNPALD